MSRLDQIRADESGVLFRLRKRAEIRRQIESRKSVQEGKPDRIADLLEEAATDIGHLLSLIDDLTAVVRACEHAGEFCDEPACPVCLSRYFKNHSNECALKAALRRVEE